MSVCARVCVCVVIKFLYVYVSCGGYTRVVECVCVEMCVCGKCVLLYGLWCVYPWCGCPILIPTTDPGVMGVIGVAGVTGCDPGVTGRDPGVREVMRGTSSGERRKVRV